MPAQRMETPITIREAVLAIQQRAYLLPAIQRELVWGAEQMEALFDSLLRQYPVGSFLFWKVEPSSSQRYKFYEFMQHYHALTKKHLSPFEIPEPRPLTIVLDGQQRLTSLTLGLLGYRADKTKGKWSTNPDAYPKRRLYLNLTRPYDSDEEIDREYDFRFLTDEEVQEQVSEIHWFPINKTLSFATRNDIDMVKLISYVQSNHLNAFGSSTLPKLCQIIIKDPTVHYFQEDEQELNRVLNIFVRLNSGGTPLSYSDLLLSIATAQWKSDAREAINGLVDELNDLGDGFDFDKDFVLKSALVLTDRPSIKFSVDNFDKQNTKAIEEGWDDSVRKPLLRATALAASFGYHGKTLTSANVLIPVAYYLKQVNAQQQFITHPKFSTHRFFLRKWLIVGLLKSVFGAKTDTLLAAARTTLQNNKGELFPLSALDETFSTHGRSLKFSDDDLEMLIDTEYGRRNTFSVLAAVYPTLNTQFKFHLDHIYPRSSFRKRRLRELGISDPEIENFLSNVNTLTNLQFLEGTANQAKGDIAFDRWMDPIEGKSSEWIQYRSLHMIPELSDYSLRNFASFLAGRRQLLLKKLKSELAVMPANDSNA